MWLDGDETTSRRIELAPGEHSLVIQLFAQSIERELIVSRVARCLARFEAQAGERYSLEGTVDADCRARVLRERDTSPVGECSCTTHTRMRKRKVGGGEIEGDHGPPIIVVPPM